MATTTLDPRIRRRRIEVRREEGRRRLRVLVAVVSACALAGAGWSLTRSALLDVDRVHVRGAGHTPVAAVLDAAGVRPGDPMTGVGERRVAGRVARLPWVGRVRVRRTWPGTVLITVKERSPVAAAAARDGAWMLVDRDGRLLERVPAAPPGLPLLTGLAPATDAGTALPPEARPALGVAAALSPELRTRVAGVQRMPSGDLELGLVPQGVVRLGPPDQVGEKLLALTTVLGKVDLRGVAVVDVRVPSAPVVIRG